VRFSLIMATMGRTEEVVAFMTSLQRQSFTDFELIVVDQNDDDRLADICRRFQAVFPVHHHRSSVKRNAHARNAGMPFCTGEIVGFPDDDCLYPEDLLLSVHQSFLRDPRLDVLTGTAMSPSGGLSSGRWCKTPGEIGLDTVWTSVIEFNLFIKASLLDGLQGFDENLGIGARFGSSEGPDLVLRAIESGARAVYDPSKAVVHPDKSLTPAAIARAFGYGAGMGYVIRKHRIKPSIYMAFFVRPLGGIILNLARLRVSAATYYWNTLRGRAYGFRSFPAKSN
jgi:glycosyltransferase involved in cell wall biosynthesis